MSNRAERRRHARMVRSSDGVLRQFTPTGVQPLPDSRNRGTIPEVGPGQHLWVMTGLWSIADPASAYDPTVQKYLDLENLISIDGPGCFVCEQMWTAEVAARPCPGEPR
jgi:hypothetical protein